MRVAAAASVFIATSSGLLLLAHKRRRAARHVLHVRLHQLASELRAEHPRSWSILTTGKGELAWLSLHRYLRKRRIPVGTQPQHLNSPSWQVNALEALLVFLRGHVRSGLEVRRSTIQKAGQGLFTTRNFRRGELLCVYRGDKVSLMQAIKRRKNGTHGDYVMAGFGLNWRIDAEKHPHVLARYINDNFDQSRLNIKFVKLKSLFVALCITTCDVPAGSELFASYGRGYWANR